MTNEQINLLHHVADRLHDIARAYTVDSPSVPPAIYMAQEVVTALQVLLEVIERGKQDG